MKDLAYSAKEIAKQNERIEKVQAAPGKPFDFGQYRLVEVPVSSD